MEKGLLEELEKLKSRGYTSNFIRKNETLYCTDKDLNFRIYELLITEHYRFESKHDPFKNVVVYTVESAECSVKGLLINQSSAELAEESLNSTS